MEAHESSELIEHGEHGADKNKNRTALTISVLAMVLAMVRESSIPRGSMVFLAQVEGFQTLDQERLEFGIWNLQVMGLYDHRVERLGESA